MSRKTSAPFYYICGTEREIGTLSTSGCFSDDGLVMNESIDWKISDCTSKPTAFRMNDSILYESEIQSHDLGNKEKYLDIAGNCLSGIQIWCIKL